LTACGPLGVGDGAADPFAQRGPVRQTLLRALHPVDDAQVVGRAHPHAAAGAAAGRGSDAGSRFSRRGSDGFESDRVTRFSMPAWMPHAAAHAAVGPPGPSMRALPKPLFRFDAGGLDDLAPLLRLGQLKPGQRLGRGGEGLGARHPHRRLSWWPIRGWC